jgi:hypothetical protein
VYSTYVLERQYDENDKGANFDIASYLIGVAILVFNLFWVYVEVRQMILSGREYFTFFWNYLDVSSIIMNSAVVIMNFSDASFKDTNRLAAISVLVLYFKLFYFLRIFFATAYLVRMIIEIMLDMKFFVGVLILATAAFGNAFYILGRNSADEDGNLAGDNYIDAFLFSYKIGLGDFSTDGFNTKDEEMLWIFFLLNSMIILIILLNLLIAIMGDTFDRVQETQENSMFKELASMILENEFLFSRVREFSHAKYILVIEPEKVDGVRNINWEGKITQLRKFIEESSKEHVQRLNILQENVENKGKFVN